MTARQLAPALVLVLLVPGDLAFAQRSHGGRGGGGGHRGGGGGSAVSRGSSMAGRQSAPRMWSGSARSSVRGGAVSGPRGGGVAQFRHPRAGTGRGYGSYYWNGGHHGGYYGGRYGYRPYYYGGYYPYHRPYVSGSIYWGWPYYSASLYYPWPYYSTWPSYAGAYYADSFYGSSGNGVVAYSTNDYEAGGSAPPPASYRAPRDTEPAPRTGRTPAIVLMGDSGQLRLEVRPDDASVYVDDEFRGTAAAARQLTLSPGRHRIELVRPGYAIERREVVIVKDERSDLLVELQRP